MYKLVCITAYTNAGKDYLCRELINKHGFEKPIGVTTRDIRVGEVNGREYNFITREKFFQLAETVGYISERASFINTAEGRDLVYYGLTNKAIDNTKKQVVIVDEKGAIQLSNRLGRENILVIRLKCDDEVIIQRAKERGDDLNSVYQRLEQDKKDFTDFYDYELNTSQGTLQYVDYVNLKAETELASHLPKVETSSNQI